MNRRRRAAVLLLLAALAGLAAAGITGSRQRDSAAAYGELRPVVITRAALTGGEPITGRKARRQLGVVRVPARFIPAGALEQPAQAVGLAPVGSLPPDHYLTAALLRPPRRAAPGRPSGYGLAAGRQPVEISVSGASAITYARGTRRVDVVVTAEAGVGGQGRTYVAARNVPLLDLTPSRDAGAAGGAVAVLGLLPRQALHLIRAESYARGIRLLPRPSGTGTS